MRRPRLSAETGSAVVAGVDPSKFGAGQLVVDLVYDPPLTPFLLEASRQGATVRNGLGMLVHQAAHQIRLWTGADPPLSVMWSVVGGDASRDRSAQPHERAPEPPGDEPEPYREAAQPDGEPNQPGG